MGKIVRSAHFIDERYYVDVPVAPLEDVAPAPSFDEGDRLAAALRAPDVPRSYDNYDELPPLTPEPELPVAVDWETLRADAEAIVDRAAADAETLIKQAQTSAL